MRLLVCLDASAPVSLTQPRLSSARLLLHVSRQVITRVVDMDERPVDDRDGLEHVLQTLAMMSGLVGHESITRKDKQKTGLGVDLPKIVTVL